MALVFGSFIETKYKSNHAAIVSEKWTRNKHESVCLQFAKQFYKIVKVISDNKAWLIGLLNTGSVLYAFI